MTEPPEDPDPSPGPDAEADATPAPVALWTAPEIAIGALLLGFPAGLGVAARNWYRLGQRRRAWLHLLVGALGLTSVAFVVLPVPISLAINATVSAYLYVQIKADHDRLAAQGRPVVRAPGITALATAAGGWLLLLAPAFVLTTAGALTSGVVGTPARGTVTFGTGGSECQVARVEGSYTGEQSIRYVVWFSRSVRSGEVVHATLRDDESTLIDANDVTMTSDSDCLYGAVPPGSLEPGVYAFEYDVGAEQLARGELTISP